MENVGLENAAQPEAAEKEETSAAPDTTPEAEKEVFVPVKFNKEIKNLGLEDAARLAQMGLKFEAIADDYEALKNIGRESGPQCFRIYSGTQKAKRRGTPAGADR